MMAADFCNHDIACSRSSSPQDYGDAYSDLANRAGIISCQEHGTSSPAMPAERRVRYEQLMFIWLRLLHNCENAKDCVSFARQSTKKLKDNSDKRDVDIANANEAFSNVSYPADPSLFDPFKPALQRYEATLKELLTIQDKLIWAKFEREQKAANLLEEAKKKYTIVDSDVTQGLIYARPSSCVPWSYALYAIQRADSAEAASVETDGILSHVLELDAANQTKNVSNLRTELAKKKPDIETLKNSKSTCK